MGDSARHTIVRALIDVLYLEALTLHDPLTDTSQKRVVVRYTVAGSRRGDVSTIYVCRFQEPTQFSTVGTGYRLSVRRVGTGTTAAPATNMRLRAPRARSGLLGRNLGLPGRPEPEARADQRQLWRNDCVDCVPAT